MARDGADAEAIAQSLASRQPDAVILAVTSRVAEKFIRGYRAGGATTQFYSFSALDGPALHRGLGGQSAGVVISQVVPYPWSETIPVVKEYQKAMKKSGQTALSYGSLEGYISMKILVEALKLAGSDVTAESTRRALEGLGQYNLGGVYVRYAPNDHAGLRFNELTMLNRRGEYVR